MKSMENKAGYKKTKVGWIPTEWNVATVEDSFNICNNGRKPISEEVRKTMQGQYPYYGPTKIQDYINEFQFEGRYALIAEDGDHFLKYSEKPMTQIAEGEFNVNNHAHVIQGKKGITSTDWFYWFFMNRNIYSHLTRQGAGRYKLNKKSLQQLKVALPSLQEQQKIATILSTCDKAIDKLSALIDAKEEQKKGLMQRLLTGKVQLKGFIENWTETSLGHHFKLNTEKVIHEIDLPVFTSSHKGLMLQSEYYDTSRITNKTIVGNNVLPPKYFTYRSRSDSGFFKFNRNDTSYCGCISKYYPVFIPKGSDSQFMFFFLNYFSSRFRAFASGTSQLVLSFNQFCKVKFKIPSLSEQHEIGALLNVMENTIILLKQRKEQLELEKKGLMQQLLTGKTRVKLN